jgi:hypothetical protein
VPVATRLVVSLATVVVLTAGGGAIIGAGVAHAATCSQARRVEGIADYGYRDTSLADYEEDHLVPLELGGSPRDPRNLWPEPHSGTMNSFTEDGVETKLKNAVCAGTITLSHPNPVGAT